MSHHTAKTIRRHLQPLFKKRWLLYFSNSWVNSHQEGCRSEEDGNKRSWESLPWCCLMPYMGNISTETNFFFSFICISWRLITSQHFSGFCHTLTWISHGVTCIPHPDPPSHLPLHLIPLAENDFESGKNCKVYLKPLEATSVRTLKQATMLLLVL